MPSAGNLQQAPRWRHLPSLLLYVALQIGVYVATTVPNLQGLDVIRSFTDQGVNHLGLSGGCRGPWEQCSDYLDKFDPTMTLFTHMWDSSPSARAFAEGYTYWMLWLLIAAVCLSVARLRKTTIAVTLIATGLNVAFVVTSVSWYIQASHLASVHFGGRAEYAPASAYFYGAAWGRGFWAGVATLTFVLGSLISNVLLFVVEKRRDGVFLEGSDQALYKEREAAESPLLVEPKVALKA